MMRLTAQLDAALNHVQIAIQAINVLRDVPIHLALTVIPESHALLPARKIHALLVIREASVLRDVLSLHVLHASQE